jgi:gliding motility-associated-like protein
MELHSTGSSKGEFIDFSWSTLNGLINGNADFDSTEIAMEGIYYLTILNTSNGCSAIDSIEIVALENDMHDLTAELTSPSCPGSENGKIVLSEVLGGNPPFLYALNEGIFSAAQVFTELSEGEYIISVKDQDGCLLISSVILEPEDLFEIDLGPDLNVPSGESITIALNTNLNSEAIESIVWYPEELTSCMDCKEIELIISQDTTISVNVVDTNGCANSTFINIQVLISDNYYIPNIFSPNQDGVNDYFQVYSAGAIKEIKQMIIFDKRGFPYFHGKSITPNEASEGWDGKKAGHKAGQGVYIYYIELELKTGEIIWESGDITLLR